MSEYKELISCLHALEVPIFIHASANQTETVESFLTIIVRKTKLEDKISLLANWTESSIKARKINIILSAQNEIPNMTYVEELYNMISGISFKHCVFYKYVEYLPDSKIPDSIDDLSTVIGNQSNQITVKVKDLKFHVAKFNADQYGRCIKVAVYVNEIVDKLIKSTNSEDHWIPDPNLFYLLDLVLGEYHMTKHISNINFFPSIILTDSTTCLTAVEAKETINELMRLDVKTCNICHAPEYRVKILQQSGSCINCL